MPKWVRMEDFFCLYLLCYVEILWLIDVNFLLMSFNLHFFSFGQLSFFFYDRITALIL